MPLQLNPGEVAELPRRRRGPGLLRPFARILAGAAGGLAFLALIGWLNGAR